METLIDQIVVEANLDIMNEKLLRNENLGSLSLYETWIFFTTKALSAPTFSYMIFINELIKLPNSVISNM